MSVSTALPQPCSVSLQVVQAGVTTLPGDSVGGVPSVVKSITALWGWDISESTGSAKAKVAIWDGTGTGTGNFCRAVLDIASGGESEHSADTPIQILNGAIYLQVISGSIDGDIQWS